MSNRLYLNFKRFERQLRNWEANAQGFGNGPAPRLSAANYETLGRINQNINNFKKRVNNSVAANKARGINSAVGKITNLEKRRFNYTAQGPSPRTRQTLMTEIARLEKQIGNKIKMINKARANAQRAESARIKRLVGRAALHWRERTARPASKGSPGSRVYRTAKRAFNLRTGHIRNVGTSPMPSPPSPRFRNRGTSMSPKRRKT
jgi:hypothetical protein